MSIFQFLALLGIINIVLAFIWQVIFAIPLAILLTVLKIKRWMFVTSIFFSYVVVSLNALTILNATQYVNEDWTSLPFPLAGGFFLLMGLLTMASLNHKTREENYDIYDNSFISRLEENGWLDFIVILGSMILYILIFFIPDIARNPLNEWLLEIILWVYGLPIIGWFLRIGGFLVMIGIVIIGVSVVLTIFSQIYIRIRYYKIIKENKK